MGDRLVIPKNLTNSILKILHGGHPGIVKMKALSRNYVWWPGIDQEIEQTVKKCRPCQETRPDKKRMPVHEWDQAPGPFSRIHIDHMGPFRGKLYLVVVDAYSKWMDVQQVPSTSSAPAIRILRRLFAYFGVPDAIVSDNGRGFVSAEFTQFCKSNLIHHIRTAPYHPASNGHAEKAVQSAKNFLKKLPGNAEIEKELANFLLTQRVIPINGKAPCEYMNGRMLSTCLSKIQPSQTGENHHNYSNDKNYFSSKQKVYIRNYARGPRWIEATVLHRKGYRNYVVELNNGQTTKRHCDQIRNRVIHDEFPEIENIDLELPTVEENPLTDDVIEEEDDFQDASMEGMIEPEPIIRRSKRILERTSSNKCK